MKKLILQTVNEIRREDVVKLLNFLLILSIPFSNYTIDIGFSLKPYMIVSFVVIVFNYSSIYHFITKFELQKFIKKMNQFEKSFLLFLTAYSMTIVFATYKVASLRMIAGLILFILCYLAYRISFDKIRIDKIYKYVYYTGVIFNIISLILYLLGVVSVDFNFHGNQFTSFGLMLDRNNPRLIGVLSDPNFFALYNILFISMFATRKYSKYSISILSLATINSILTMSRSGLIATFILFIILFFEKIFVSKISIIDFRITRKKTIAILITIISLSLIAIFIFNPIDYIISRFNVRDGGTGRVQLIKNGLVMLKDSNFVGIGIFNYRSLNLEMFGKTHYMHSTIFEILVEGGPIVFILFIYSFFQLLSMAKIPTLKDNFLFATLISTIFMLLTLTMLVNEIFFLLIVLINLNYFWFSQKVND